MMHIKMIIDYHDRLRAFQFELILRNNTHLSVIGGLSKGYVEVVQLIDGKMTMTPRFEHDRYGIQTILLSELREFVVSLEKQ